MKRTILVGVMVLGTSFCSQSFGFDLLDRMLGLKGSGCDSSCCDTTLGTHSSFGGYEPACGIEDPCGGCATEPTCGIGSGFGLGSACGGCAEAACGCEVVSDCGCASGCDTACGANKRGHLLHRLFSGLGCGNHGCDSACGDVCGGACGDACGGYADPSCGCESGHGHGLLGGHRGGHGLFGGPSCGCEGLNDCGCGAAASDCGCATGCDSLCGGNRRGGLLKRLFGHLHGNNDCCDTGCDVAVGCSNCLNSPISAPTMAPTMDIDSQDQVSPMPPAPVVDPSAHLHSKRRVIQASTHYTR